MSKRKGDFTQATKEKMAKRAGFRCSFPNCGAPTSGPSAESGSSTSNTGMACHIVAASEGAQARRAEQSWDAKRLSNIKNGIWMCHTHGKLIDSDESTYTVEMLKTWRHLSELRAGLSQKRGANIELTPSFVGKEPMPDFYTEIVTLGSEVRVIGDAIDGSCMAQIWGVKLSRAVRDVLIEIAQNSIAHGNAKKVQLIVNPRSVQLIDDGLEFNPIQLRGSASNNGGALALRFLLKDFGSSLYHSYRRKAGKNILEVSWVNSQEEIRALTACTVDVPVESFQENSKPVLIPSNCNTVFLMFPEYFALSWALRTPKIVSELVSKYQEFILVGECLSDGVVEVLKTQLPNVSVINFEKPTR